jgi:hypothetical protein
MEMDPSDFIMRNDLQTYVGNSGLLPTTNPYGGSETCPEINNSAVMSRVVDWVKVEIRDAANPSVLLESRNLILSGTGFVVNLDGTAQPYFAAQPQPVRIVVKHRNHLAVMSNPIQDFTSGFLTTISLQPYQQASNEFGDPDQMVQKNGIWCMWAGDVGSGQDLGIDATDLNVSLRLKSTDTSRRLYHNRFEHGWRGRCFRLQPGIL